MRRVAAIVVLCLTGLVGAGPASVPSTQPTTAGVGRFPHLEVDLKKREVRVECESLNPQMPIEFFCVLSGTSEHESVLRSEVRPMHLHTALLMLGAKPGEPTKYSESEKRWLPPHGQPLELFVESQRNGKTVREPAAAWMREVKSHKAPEHFEWVFAGSRVMPDGTYAADTTGYIVSVVNFDYTLIDVPRLASNSNETLEYEYNPETVPAKGTKVTLIIRPASAGPATREAR